MTTTELAHYAIDIEDIEYIRHGDKPLLARVYKPRGTGPFPLIIDLHGGAWCKKDRTSDAGTDEPLAKSGVVVVALDFRMPPDGSYPAPLADINYAIRWCKSRASVWGASANRVGILGVSSGGHQAMLAAMRPADARYTVLQMPGNEAVDATVRCAVMCWPVIDPLGRYQYAKSLQSGTDVKLKKAADEWVVCHDKYWAGEAAMAEGNPTLALERGEKVAMPPVLYLQGTADVAHPIPNRERFIAAYRKAGGRVELHLFDGVGEAFITNDPDSLAARDAIDKIIEFVHREMH
jgi:acetyl esterase/lipase